MTNHHTAFGNNRLLNFLTIENRAQFVDYCEIVDLNLGEVLGNPGDTIQYIYFPTEGIISWEKQIEDSPYLVVTLIGNEGMLCISLMQGVNITPCRAVVQKAGFALRITAADFLYQIEHNQQLNLLLRGYVIVAHNQLLQTAACNLFHVLENRLARLLLMFQDRAQSDELFITQELLAQMLGVRRVGVTKAAGSLRRKNLISYIRGNVIIHDRTNLKAASCSCYQADKLAYENILDIDKSSLSNTSQNDQQLVDKIS